MPYRNPRFDFGSTKMAHGDAARMAEICERFGLPLVTWQRDLLHRMESASMDQQFREIVRNI